MSLTGLAPEQIASRLYRAGSVHVALPGPDAVTDDHVEQFRRDGFLAVERVYSPGEVASATDAVSFLCRGGNPSFKGVQLETGDGSGGELAASADGEDRVRKLWRFVDHEPRLRAMSEHPALLALVRRLLDGHDVTMIQDMALLKPPHVGGEKPWHQDTAYFAMDPPELILGTWTALDAATVDNGCMHVIPGSHQKGPQPHYHDRDCQLPDDRIDVDHTVAIPLKPGGVLLFSGLLHHGTPPNRSALRRRALQFHYASTQCRRTGAEHEILFHDDKGYAGCAGAAGKKTRHVSERDF